MSIQQLTVRALKPNSTAVGAISLMALLSPLAWWIADRSANAELPYNESMPIAALGTSALLSAIGIVLLPKQKWPIAVAATVIALCATTLFSASARTGIPSLSIMFAITAVLGGLAGPLFIRGETTGLRCSLAILVWMMVGFVATTQNYSHTYALDRLSVQRTNHAPIMLERLEKAGFVALFQDPRVSWDGNEITKDKNGRFLRFTASGTLIATNGKINATVQGDVLTYTIWLQAPEKYKLQKFETSADRLAYAKSWLSTMGFRENGYRLQNLKSWNWGYTGPRAPGRVRVEVGNGKNVFVNGVINPDWM